jgi:hypothetical protein
MLPMSESQPVDVSINVDSKMSEGKLQPQTVTWRGRRFQVIGVGRQWADNHGTYILVELHDHSRMEIRLGYDLNWQLCRYWPVSAVA